MTRNLDSDRVSTLTRFKDLIIDKAASEDMDLPEYERVKVVGKGSFGVAVLYKRLHDNKLVVLKQINLADLTPSERHLAMNEVEIFSKLHHPNIISYYGSFVRENTLLIEMEYADDGTLNTLLMTRGDSFYFAEQYVLNIFEQITSAINYMHGENILHRDLKTANIFLTARGTVKIGDFGISKIMNTKIHAQTVLGTPYYFSPEMCEGKGYNEKSDIWALGCILGEICGLKKAFAATNLSELVGKIMSGQYLPIPDCYSDGLRYLLKQLLQINADDRPSAADLLKYWIPLVYKNMDGKNGLKGFPKKTDADLEVSDIHKTSTKSKQSSMDMNLEETAAPTPSVRSVLYQLKSFESSTSLDPLQLPPTLVIRKVVTSGKHFVVISSEGVVYTWGEGNKGQLGHNAIESWKHIPTKVDLLKKHHIVDACAGDNFTLFLTNFGEVLSCGDNSNGCLGHGKMDAEVLLIPRIIEKFRDINIVQICAGYQHVLALTDTHEIYSWGRNTHGELSAMGHRYTALLPKRILTQNLFKPDERVERIYCGGDCSAALMSSGSVYCSGRNNCNKLGFGSGVKDVPRLTRLMITGKRITDISVSLNHSALLLEGGYVLTLGSNAEGQRGIGNTDTASMPTIVSAIQDKHILNVKAQATYTVASSDDNVITFWGTRYGIPEANDPDVRINLDNTGKKSDISSIGNNTAAFTNFLTSVYKSELVLEPIDILALYSAPDQLSRGNYVRLVDICPLYHSVLVLVETTTPLTNRVQQHQQMKGA